METAREVILKRIAEIKEKEQGFTTKVMRWKSCHHGLLHISEVKFEELSDASLVDVFEYILFRFYKQM